MLSKRGSGRHSVYHPLSEKIVRAGEEIPRAPRRTSLTLQRLKHILLEPKADPFVSKVSIMPYMAHTHRERLHRHCMTLLHQSFASEKL